MVKGLLVSLFVVSFMGSLVFAHNGEHLGEVSVELLQSPIGLESGAGRAYLLKETDDFSKYVNQSAAYLNVFDWSSAYRSALQAYRLNKNSTWSLTFQLISLVNLDQSAAQKYGPQIVKQLNQMLDGSISLALEEKLWAELAVGLYESDDQKLQTAWDTLMFEFPDSIEVLTLANWQVGARDMLAFEKALKINPNHPGANHYIGHMYEGLEQHDKALMHTKKLSEVSSGSAHAQHMYGHVLPHVGKWDEAIGQFEIAHAIHLNWAKKNNVDPGEDWHYSHNLHLMGTAYFANGNGEKGMDFLLEGCQYDTRSCFGFLEMGLSLKAYDKVAEVLDAFESMGIDTKNMLAPWRAELSFLMKGQKLNLKGPKSNGFYDVASYAIINAPKDTVLEDETKQLLVEYFENRLDGAGFDAWTTGLFELTRLIRILEKQGNADFAKQLYGIVKKDAPNLVLPGL